MIAMHDDDMVLGLGDCMKSALADCVGSRPEDESAEVILPITVTFSEVSKALVDELRSQGYDRVTWETLDDGTLDVLDR